MMIVKTSNPVLVNNKHESDASKYIPFDGAGKSEAQIRAFQDWLDIKHPNWVFGKNLNGKALNLTKKQGYGNYGGATQAAAKLYGNEFDEMMSSLGASLGGMAMGGDQQSAPTVANIDTTTVPTVAETNRRAKLGQVWQRGKGWIQEGKLQGAVDTAGGLFGSFKNLFGGGSTPSAIDTTIPQGTPTVGKMGMSTGAKIGIAVGGAVVLGLIIYAVTKKNK